MKLFSNNIKKGAGVVEQEGLTPSQGNEESWLADTELHQKDRRRAMEFDRPLDGELGAALGGAEDNNSVHDDEAPELHPEQRIREEEEMHIPPRRQPRGVESQQPKGPRVGGGGRIDFKAGVHGSTAGKDDGP